MCLPGRRSCLHHSHRDWSLCRVHCSSRRLCPQTARCFRLQTGSSYGCPLLHCLQSSDPQVRARCFSSFISATAEVHKVSCWWSNLTDITVAPDGGTRIIIIISRYAVFLQIPCLKQLVLAPVSLRPTS